MYDVKTARPVHNSWKNSKRSMEIGSSFFRFHGRIFAQPTNKENKLPLDNTFGAQLISRFNQPQGLSLRHRSQSRKVFGDESSIFLRRNFLAGYVVEENQRTLPSNCHSRCNTCLLSVL
ncbi:MAG: hypothetical protein IPP04_17100 [Saprospiraceae bacterium]|nr:hypothetical protein [Saprospiraceae bacterium]